MKTLKQKKQIQEPKQILKYVVELSEIEIGLLKKLTNKKLNITKTDRIFHNNELIYILTMTPTIGNQINNLLWSARMENIISGEWQTEDLAIQYQMLACKIGYSELNIYTKIEDLENNGL